MPVYFKQCAKIGELLDLNVDAIAVPRLQNKPDLPKITKYIYSQADENKINRLYEENKGNDYWWEEHFPDFPADEYDEQCDMVSDSDPIITATEGCGLNFKYIFHVCMGLPENYGIITESGFPELYEALNNENWSEDDVKIAEFDDPYAPDEEDCFILRRCYETVLYCAQKRGVRSIAIPMLGVEDNSGFPYSVAYHVAHTVPRAWLEKHASYEQTDENTKIIGGYSGQYRLREEPEIWIIDPPYNFKWSYNPVPNVTDEDELDERKKPFRVFERNLKERIESSGKPPEKFARDFIRECFNDVNVSDLNVLISYDATKFKNGQLKKPALHRVIAIAAGLGLNDFDRYTLIRCAGYNNYPSTDFDFDVEAALAAGTRDFDALNEVLREKGYGDRPLDANVRGSKKGKRKSSK